MHPRLQSFIHAFRGIRFGFAGINFKIQATIGLLAMGLSVATKISGLEFLSVILCIIIVLAAELFNTATEKLCDHLHPEKHPNIGKVKDLAAGAVLLLSIGSAIVGLYIFIPAFCK
ncbi:MAG: diacylglycerol kinase family protein [Flavobacteriaceae bacterium]|nr:diacylglycerol kinase family protein [Flavobacteriaceae bacterium]